MYICQHISLNILVYFQYFYYVGIFLQFLIFFDIFSVFFGKEKGKGRAAAGGTCNEPCLHPPKALAGFRRMTAVAVTSQKKNRFG